MSNNVLLMSIDKDIVIWVLGAIGAVAIAVGTFMGNSVVSVLKKILEAIEQLNINHARHDERIKNLNEKTEDLHERTDKHEDRLLKLEQKKSAA